MKKTSKALFTIAALSMTISMLPMVTYAAEPLSPTLPQECDDIGYETINSITVDPSAGAADDTFIIQNALDQAQGKDDSVLTDITLSSGEYVITGTLYIYSNTRLILEDGAVVKRSDNGYGEMVMSGANVTTTLGGYDAVHNVFIEGGTWDANANLAANDFSNVIVVVHGENLIFRNITIKDSVNHMLNLSGTNKVLVENCTFMDSQIYTGDSTNFFNSGTTEEKKIARHNPIEAIHLDFMNEAGESGVLDGTPCKNITIKNCSFNNVFRGIGTHHTRSTSPNDPDYATDHANLVNIEGNTFTNVRAACVSGYSFKNMTIKNNTATNIGHFCDFLDSHDCLISGNSISGTVSPATYSNYTSILSPLFIKTSSGIAISGNIIDSDEKIHSNIMISGSCSDISIDSNNLSGADTTCIHITDSDGIVINNISKERKNTYSTNGEKDILAINSTVTIGYEEFGNSIHIDQSNVTITNCTIDGGYILLSKAHKATIKDNTINTTNTSTLACIYATSCDDDITISENNLSNAGNYCIYLTNNKEHDISISGNTFSKMQSDMVFIETSDTVTVSDNIMNKATTSYKRAVNAYSSTVDIKNNTISGFTDVGIATGRNTTATISGNTASGGTHAIQADNSDVTIKDNTFKDSSGIPAQAQGSTGSFENNTVTGSANTGSQKVQGVQFMNCTNMTISKNKISGTTGIGMQCLDCKNLTISENSISDPAEHGIYLGNVNTATVSNNTFTNIPNYKYKVRVLDNCVNITVTPESDKEFVTPTPTNNPTTNPTTNPTINPTTKPTTAPTAKPTANPTSAPTQAPAKEATFEDFVERLYVVALERESEPDGKAYWCGKVKDGTFDGAYCARFFLTSPEFLGKNKSDGEFVDTLYRTFFGRDADDEGRAFWVKKIKESSKEAVVEGFINSEEWCNICASYGVRSGAQWAKASVASKNATDFASRLYTKCLGRDAEEGGLKYWSLALTNLEITGSQAAREFFYSDEFKGFNTSNEVYVVRMYETFMGREPEGEGKAYWIDYLNKGGSRDEMFNFFSTCPEFTEICASYSIER